MGLVFGKLRENVGTTAFVSTDSGGKISLSRNGCLRRSSRALFRRTRNLKKDMTMSIFKDMNWVRIKHKLLMDSLFTSSLYLI